MGDWRGSDERLLLLSAHALVILLVLGILVLALGFLFTIQHGKFLLELVVFHTELASDGDKAT